MYGLSDALQERQRERDEARAEVKRLRAENKELFDALVDEGVKVRELQAEVERLRRRVAELDEAEADALEKADELEAEVERLRADLRSAEDEAHTLRRDKDNLRKAVTWLMGALHDESPRHQQAWYEDGPCEVWECRRARDRLAETAE
jgi:chromosome segregation ATPase